MSGTTLFHIAFAAFVVVFISVVWVAILLEAPSQPPASGPDASSGRQAAIPGTSTDAKSPAADASPPKQDTSRPAATNGPREGEDSHRSS
jgi:hypothetical protein